jgi:hypothetical protein
VKETRTCLFNNLPVLTPTGDTLAWYLGSRAKVTADYDGRYCAGFDKDWITSIETIVDLKFISVTAKPNILPL